MGLTRCTVTVKKSCIAVHKGLQPYLPVTTYDEMCWVPAQRIRATCSRVQLEQCQGEGHKLTQSFIRHLAGNHSGFEALLLPLVSDPCAQMLYQQCQLALKAPKASSPSTAAAQADHGH